MLLPDQNALLYMPPATNPAGWPLSDTLLLDPPAGYLTSIYKIARLAQQASSSIEIPFLSYDQNALSHVILAAVSEPHRGRGKSRVRQAQGINKVTVLEKLSNEHWITKAWLQYFRCIVLRYSITEIALDISIAQSQWRRWEYPSPHLPPLQWAHLLWRWWERNRDWRLSYRYDPEQRVTWRMVANENDRANLRKSWRPGFYKQSSLHDPIKDKQRTKRK